MTIKHPKKRLGQNFLTDKNVARKIVASADISSPRLIIEIGPGKGVLTEFLLPVCEQYVGIEIDGDLAGHLKDRFSRYDNFTLIESDFLQVDLAEIISNYAQPNTAVIGNIPYNITSPILFKLFDNADILDQAVLMMQKEVGQRLVARMGSKDYGLLAINGQLFTDVKSLFHVRARLFFPQPQVDSSVLRFNFKKGIRESFSDFELFRKILRHCFQHRRKMLRKTLSMLFSSTLLSKLGADLTRRPEQLSIDDWRELTDLIYLHLREESRS